MNDLKDVQIHFNTCMTDIFNCTRVRLWVLDSMTGIFQSYAFNDRLS